MALGGLAGGLAGGAVDGFRAGLAKLRARPVTSDQPSSDQPSSASAGARNPPGDPGLRRAAREAERALADFAEAARELDDHPRLAAFWREVDRQAAARFDGARDGVLREMANHRRHPLHLLFERHASADPNVALHHRRPLASRLARAIFDPLPFVLGLQHILSSDASKFVKEEYPIHKTLKQTKTNKPKKKIKEPLTPK